MKEKINSFFLSATSIENYFRFVCIYFGLTLSIRWSDDKTNSFNFKFADDFNCAY